MTSVQIESGTFDNWRALINSMLLHKGRFEKLKISSKEPSDIDVFVLRDVRNEHITRIEAGYLDDRLFYLNIDNPMIPGYVQFQEGEYFHQYDFTEGKRNGIPGLEFNQVNVHGILREFKKGLQGKEVHYLRDGRVVKARLYPFPEKPDMCYTYDFEKAGLFGRLKNIFYKMRKKFEIREINLNDIFSGI